MMHLASFSVASRLNRNMYENVLRASGMMVGGSARKTSTFNVHLTSLLGDFDFVLFPLYLSATINLFGGASHSEYMS